MTTLHEIIENIWLETQDIDSLFRNKKRYMIVKNAKEGLKELKMTFATHVMGMNVKIPSSARVYKPEGYETFLRAYLLDCDGKTIEIVRNNKMPDEIYQYLVDCDGSILGDCDGDLYTDCVACNSKLVDVDRCDCTECHGTGKNYISPDAEFMYAALEKYKDSWVKAKDTLPYIEFSPDLEGMYVVVEYLSNNTVGVDECNIQVDDNMKNALDYYIKFKLLENGIETMQQAQYYWRKFKQLRDKELVKENALTKTDLYGLLLLK